MPGEKTEQKIDLVEPHGGKLVNLFVNNFQAGNMKQKLHDMKTLYLNERQKCDLDLIINGGFSPLKGFMDEDDYHSVVEHLCLKDKTLWSIPVILDVNENFASNIRYDDQIALLDSDGTIVAIMDVQSKWNPDLLYEAEKIYGTTSKDHWGVKYLLEQTNDIFLGGEIHALHPIQHYFFKSLWHSPLQMRKLFQSLGWKRVVAFQTRNPMHRAHFELTLRAMEELGAKLLIHSTVGPTMPNDIDYITRTKCLKLVLNRYPKDSAMLSLVPLAMRMAGPREAVLHAILRKNFGCSYFIVGRDHAGPGKDSKGENFYDPYESQQLLDKYKNELGIEIIPFEEMVYVEELKKYMQISEVPKNSTVLRISGTELRAKIHNDFTIPDWITFPEVASQLLRIKNQKSSKGFAILFSGLPSSGKSTLAKCLCAKLIETESRLVTLVDADMVRRTVSSDLGFTKEDRNKNIRRIGQIAAEIIQRGGIAVCTAIAPYDIIRKEIRDLLNKKGDFILIYVSTPVEVCEKRDSKGLYLKARSGHIKNFTGIDDPYEVPHDAEIVIDTSSISTDNAIDKIVFYLKERGIIKLSQSSGG